MKVPQHTNSIPLKKSNFSLLKLVWRSLWPRVRILLAAKASYQDLIIIHIGGIVGFCQLNYQPMQTATGELHRCISCNRVYCSRLTTWAMSNNYVPTFLSAILYCPIVGCWGQFSSMCPTTTTSGSKSTF